MITIPAKILSTSEFCNSACPKNDADAPKTTKTVEKPKQNKISEKIFHKNLFKIGYVARNSKNLKSKYSNNYIVKAFQMRFRQELVDGKIDKECLIISNNLVKKFS